MKRILAVAILAISVPIGLGAPEKPWFPAAMALPPGAVVHYSSECQPGDPLQAIASGSGASPVGLYLFNAAGQCVAWDDYPVGNVVDDRIVTFVPADIGPYEVEIRNLGPNSNQVEAVFRGTTASAPAGGAER